MNTPQKPQLHKHSVMPSCLQLSLKSKWFEMTKSGVKKEDYREINERYCSRFLRFDGCKMKMQWWRAFLKHLYNFKIEESRITVVEFSQNVMTLGYPKSTDTARILKLEHKGIEIGYGVPEWGAEPNKLYFIIKHGAIL